MFKQFAFDKLKTSVKSPHHG